MKSELYKQTERRLYDYPFLVKRIEMIKKRLEELEMNSLKGYHTYLLSDEQSRFEDFIAAEASNISDFRILLQQELKEKENIVFEIEKALECLTELERQIVIMRYFKMLRMSEISDELGYSREYSSRVRKRAVNKIGMVLWGVTSEEMEKKRKEIKNFPI
ncbi:sigma factor-like helix-turn-helix DNA-binding protein [Anaerofustis stercorihominis]|uniref:sigma factor-like helix-turn-helix DNA-binding protein n=1 Tax=Anaerofustis stercorihominis TaxID=214853 RepID=UPI001106B140|nr:sigma factor-like helix-turn-helix DNA-binding protein [Anaerofustis stercorihominis]